MENSNRSNNSFGIFLFGALVGAAVVFLLATKKGKRILKIISEKGLDNLSDLLEKAEKTVDLDEIIEEENEPSFVQPSPRLPPSQMFRRTGRPASKAREEFASGEEAVEEKPKAKRFFKGISRHLN